ncbi:MAG: recombinase family protein [Clostridium sp.]|nr:recombinase family protein [Clostridium sp.]
MTKQSDYNVGIYVRLSQEDERTGESISIENQKKMLTDHVSKQAGWNLVEICEDDGYSGTTFDRPGVQKLLDDAKSGKINLILVKDLSRFGRNYIEVGQYVDYIFPSYNIRFIALGDNVDTLNRNSSAMDMMPIMNLFNEWHAANTSKKIRAVMQANAKQGKYTASIAAYGYIAGTDENRTPIIDENTAPNVRRMFEMRAQGASSPQIAKALNADHIITSSDYTYQRLGKPNPYVTTHLWSAGMVRDILKNPIYVGTIVGQKYTTVSYKNHKKYIRDEADWVVVENAFEPIISKELWDKVQEVNRSVSRGKTTRKGEILPLCGLMYCADCGSKLKKCTTTHYSKVKGKYQLVAYSCNKYANHGKSACSSHHITQNLIEKIVLTDIRAKAKMVIDDEESARKMYLAQKNALHEKQSAENIRLLKQTECRLKELDTIISKTYEDSMFGRLPEELSAKMLEKYLDEQKTLAVKIAELKKSEIQADKDKQDVDEFISRLKKYYDAPVLTREMCLELIEYIVVYERPEKYGAPRKIDIYYKFISNQLADSRNLYLPQNCTEINN